MAAQVALTLLLMATAGTAIRGFLRLTQMPLGPLPPTSCSSASRCTSTTCGSAFSRGKRRAAYIEQIREKIASVPRVSTVAVGVDATPPGADVQSSFLVDEVAMASSRRLV